MSMKNYDFNRTGFNRHGLNALRQYNRFERSPDAELTTNIDAVSK